MTNELIVERTAKMRALGDADRRDAIAAADNLIGFGRFGRTAKLADFAPKYPVQLLPEPA